MSAAGASCFVRLLLLLLLLLSQSTPPSEEPESKAGCHEKSCRGNALQQACWLLLFD
jgi:hypothetical protein